MKKIPTLFKRVYENRKIVDVLPEVEQGMEWVLEGLGEATVKIDGSCCAVIDGKYYKRFDAKNGKPAPKNAIPCCEADLITGHHPHWVEVDANNPSDKWFVAAYSDGLPEGTYEAVGKHFNGNPYQIETDKLIRHGSEIIKVERTFDGIKNYLRDNEIEGIVFWKDGEPQCKIKRKDFGYEWPIKQKLIMDE